MLTSSSTSSTSRDAIPQAEPVGSGVLSWRGGDPLAAIPIRYRLLRELFGLSVLIPAAVIVVWIALARLVRTEAADRAQHDLRLLDARIAERLERIELAAKSAAYLWGV